MTLSERHWRQDRFVEELDLCISREALTGDIQLIVDSFAATASAY